MAPLSRLLLLALFAASALAMPRPLRVHPVDEDEGAAAEMGDGDDGDDASAEADSSATRPVAILEHRQELQDDGTFNYAFSADNGLTQNEAFHPDGSRTGSYSYVDPKGETILVKYRADRFGFHVLDGSSIPSTPPHMGHDEGVQAVLDPNYFSFPSSGLSPGMGHGLGNLKTAASASSKSGKLNKGGKGAKAGVKGNLKATGKASGARARSSASSSMHYLQREARQAFVSDLDGDMLDVDGDGQESRMAFRAVRAPPGMVASSSNDVDANAEGMTAADEGNYDHHALKYDDGSYEPHAMKYDDGSYEPHAAKYDDGSYEPHAAKYDDGSYEPHAAKYDDGSYVKHIGNYDDGSYEPHAAKYDDGSYEKYAKMYGDGSYQHGEHDKGAEAGDGEGDGEGHH